MRTMKVNVSVDSLDLNVKPQMSGNIGVNASVEGLRVAKDYEELMNKPSIEHVTLVGDLSAEELGIAKQEDVPEVATYNEVINYLNS